ncbi:MAG TPA: glycosyltransferase [Acidimicrobiales bacterium]|jgi:glycosyltransferase involved in cell wall biosynthesis/GT2 family glycosyltransferase|nr:glycosyltransferase [Acidimicrobiales bacterium]
MPTISVVICAFTAERWDAIAAAVASVMAQTQAAHELVLVIDHNPELLERARAQWPHAVVVANDGQRGLSDARNTGMSRCTGDVVAFLDDDAVAPYTWLEAIGSAYASDDVIAVGSAVEPNWLAGRPRWFPPEFDWVVGCSHSGMPDHAEPVRNLIGASMSFRRDVLDDVGGFRSELGRVGTRPSGCEETEMCIRARRTRPAATVLYDPTTTVAHAVPASRASWRYFLSRCLSEGQSKAVLAGLSGPDDALASERTYVSCTLPSGVARGLGEAMGGHLSGLARAFAIVVGLMATTVGYAVERARPRPRRLTAPDDDRRQSGLLRVLMVTPRYPPDVGGVERHVYEVSRRLAPMGCEVTVLCTDRTRTMAVEQDLDGVHVRRVRAWPSRHDFYFAPGLWREMARERFDVVHVQSYHTLVAPLAMLRARRLRLPFVLTFHGGGHSSRVRHSLRPLQRRVLGPLVRHATRLIAIARFEVPLYSRDFGVPVERFTFIPNGTYLGSAAHLDVEHRANGSIIASIGRLERYKGHHRALAAMPHVLRGRPDAQLWIIGTGPDEDALRRQAQQLGVADHVEFRSVPSDEPEKMRSLLAATSLVVSLSDFETQPLAALEALAAGVALVVADTSGLRELADDGLAHAIPLGSEPAEVAAAILGELDADRDVPEITVSSWDDCATSLLELYREVSCAS